MSLHAYRESLRIDADSFSALIMAAYRKADTANEAKLRAAWPELCVEMQYRYWSAGGLMPGEDGYDPAGDDNLTSDEATS